MAVDQGALESQVAATVAALKRMEGYLETTQREVHGLGFIARSFVERDISSATGRNFGEWLAATASLRRSLSQVLEAQNATNVAAARRAITTEVPRISTLRSYLQAAPQKANKIPGAVLKPQQRTEFLRIVQEQVSGLGELEIQLATIESLLGQAG